MNFLKIGFIAILFFAVTTFSAESTITFQQGLNGYSGCQDLSIYTDETNAKLYSNWLTSEETGQKPTGSNTDMQLTTTQFAC